MNIAFFIVPKLQVLWVSASASVRDAVRLMRRHGLATAPVLDAAAGFAGTVSLKNLARLLRGGRVPAEAPLAETACVRPDAPVGIDAQLEDLVDRAVTRPFVPVVDDRRVFIGVVPRRAILRHALRPA